jgi:hypothetical protein
MRVDNFPTGWASLINLGSVPVHRSFAAVAAKPVGEDRHVARDLDARLDDFETVDVDLAANLFVPGAQSVEAIEPAFGECSISGRLGGRYGR